MYNSTPFLFQFFSIRDQKTLDDLGELLEQTEERESIVTSVSTRLHDELNLLATFLENVARRRPKGIEKKTTLLHTMQKHKVT